MVELLQITFMGNCLFIFWGNERGTGQKVGEKFLSKEQ
jgi:hypothetical protein